MTTTTTLADLRECRLSRGDDREPGLRRLRARRGFRSVAGTDVRLRRLILRCQDLPGQLLFQYVDEGGIHGIASNDVNEYPRDATGLDVSAKEFRTWIASVLAADALARLAPPESERAACRDRGRSCDRQATRQHARRYGAAARSIRVSSKPFKRASPPISGMRPRRASRVSRSRSDDCARCANGRDDGIEPRVLRDRLCRLAHG